MFVNEKCFEIYSTEKEGQIWTVCRHWAVDGIISGGRWAVVRTLPIEVIKARLLCTTTTTTRPQPTRDYLYCVSTSAHVGATDTEY